jgi:hypothetical protein
LQSANLIARGELLRRSKTRRANKYRRSLFRQAAPANRAYSSRYRENCKALMLVAERNVQHLTKNAPAAANGRIRLSLKSKTLLRRAAFLILAR